MSKKLTGWFPGDVKPARAGVYQTAQPDGDKYYNEFDGNEWSYGNHDCIPAKVWLPLPRRLLHKWRGLASDPSKGTV